MKLKIYVFAILIFAFVAAAIGASLYHYDVEEGETRNIYHFTESTLVYNASYSINELSQNVSQVEIPEIKYFRFVRIVDSFVDFAITTSFELSKTFIEFGYNNPDHDYRFYGKLLFVFFLLSFWAALVPIIAILVLIYKGAIYLVKKIKKNEKKN